MTTQIRVGGRLDANGTKWRLRSLHCLGHGSARIARALGVDERVVQRLVAGVTTSITPEFHAAVIALTDAWWCYSAPEGRAAKSARTKAREGRWPSFLAISDDEIDAPGYYPKFGYREATGLGPAPDYPLTNNVRRTA